MSQQGRIDKYLAKQLMQGNPVCRIDQYGYAEPIEPVTTVVGNMTQRELVDTVRKEYEGYTFTPALTALLKKLGL